jgi:hypothetical protein
MCYEAAIASAGGDEATLSKSLIFSLEDATIKWYSRLPLKCIYSWQQLKENFLLNFQGFQEELSTEEDFLSRAQYEKKTLTNFYRRFLQLKAQAPEVSDDQVIAEAIKGLCTGSLHSHLVSEQSKTVVGLYEFTKFSKLEVLHFRKLEQQRKASKHNEASRPTHYNDNQRSYPKQVHIIDSDACGPSENWEKNFRQPPQGRSQRTFNHKPNQYS